jgi:hypothetical protein
MNENPPKDVDIPRLTRHILAEKPRVTKFHIDWDDESQMFHAMDASADPSAQQAEGIMQKGTQMMDRQDMMNTANLAEAAQNFQTGM